MDDNYELLAIHPDAPNEASGAPTSGEWGMRDRGSASPRR